MIQYIYGLISKVRQKDALILKNSDEINECLQDLIMSAKKILAHGIFDTA